MFFLNTQYGAESINSANSKEDNARLVGDEDDDEDEEEAEDEQHSSSTGNGLTSMPIPHVESLSKLYQY